MAQYYTLPTAIGEAKIANAIALGSTITISELAIGDGGGTTPTPDSDRTTLVNQVRRAPINTSEVDPDNPNWIVVEQVLPPDIGGWTIREIGLFDADGDMIAYGNYPETYKPQLSEGSGRTQTIRFVMQVSDTAAVTLKVDPAVVLATRKYVDESDQAVSQAAAQALQQHANQEKAHSAAQVSIEEIPQTPDAKTVQQALSALGTFSADGFQNIAVFDTANVTEWHVPEVLRKGLRKANVTVIGGGGGAGNHITTGGGGGSGGGVAHKIVDLKNVMSVNVTVGDGGDGAPAASGISSGSTGGTSSFGTYCSASGGSGANNWCPGKSGVGIGGDINTGLGPGTPGTHIRGSGGMAGNPGTGGGPGSAPTGVGDDGSRGHDAEMPGGGGGGGSTNGGGGNGAPGIVIVRW